MSPEKTDQYLGLPGADLELFVDASAAVKQEYRNSICWKSMKALDVKPLSGGAEDLIYVIKVGQVIEFDWSWEGAVAFRPANIQAFQSIVKKEKDSDEMVETEQKNSVWDGEVVEVDADAGRLFVAVSDPEKRPCNGTFFVRPFEFLRSLNSIYSNEQFTPFQESLSRSLQATCGGIHPQIHQEHQQGLPWLKSVWDHSWGLIWGPPGTGKTYTIGIQVAECLKSRMGRTLVLSTTNKATDEAALSIGRACKQLNLTEIDKGVVVRIGRGVEYRRFKENELQGMLKGTEADYLQLINIKKNELLLPQPYEKKAEIRREIRELLNKMRDSADRLFSSPETRVVVCTSFKALQLVSGNRNASCLTKNTARFDTVIVDEASLIPRAAAALYSLLANKRVVFVGDPRQLAPISKVSRLLPSCKAKWLAGSTLSHLKGSDLQKPAVKMLRQQHRMHPQISRVVSEFQYENLLEDAPEITSDRSELVGFLHGQPRAIWYVLDEDGSDLPSIRAERGPGNRSWVRPATEAVLKKFFSDPEVRSVKGLFLSPFKAQSVSIAEFLARANLVNWTSSTIHSQQGAEANYVIFDTVFAGSTAWPFTEWKRLVNVAISRAKKLVIIVASRAEMNEPYLAPLREMLSERILTRGPNDYSWKEVHEEQPYEKHRVFELKSEKLGEQIHLRKMMRPVLSSEQQRLCGLEMDGKPRLVRGVAGSGKTLVMAHWVQKVMKKHYNDESYSVWVVYANRALCKLIENNIELAMSSDTGVLFQAGIKLRLLHIKEILNDLLREISDTIGEKDFDFDGHAAKYLKAKKLDQISPRCKSMFVDEAQDMGANTLKLLTRLVEQTDPSDPNSRSVNFFYDNAQNVYGRSTPMWSDMGIDMRGRSTIMKESFRSTKPISEFALNVLYRLQTPDADQDYKELIDKGLIVKTERDGRPWWHVRFNQVDGPYPEYHLFESHQLEVDAIITKLIHWIKHEGIKPADICIIYNGPQMRKSLNIKIKKELNKAGINLGIFQGQGINLNPNSISAYTAHSFKGYDSEIVLIAGADQFITSTGIMLANALYVAMTRSRSYLVIFSKKNIGVASKKLHEVMMDVSNEMIDVGAIPDREIESENFEGIVSMIGEQHRHWLEEIFEKYDISQEPITTPQGEILVEPIFHFIVGNQMLACFGSDNPPRRIAHLLEDHKIKIIQPGVPF